VPALAEFDSVTYPLDHADVAVDVLSLKPKRKKNPRLAISILRRQPNRAGPKAFGVDSGFESRPTQSRLWLGFTFSAEKSDDTRSGSTENLERRIAEHRRGSNHTTYRFSGDVQIVATNQIASMTEARNLDRVLNWM